MVPIDDLQELENKIFGSTTQKSKVSILGTAEQKPSKINILFTKSLSQGSINNLKR